jgi:hypothetical protein
VSNIVFDHVSKCYSDGFEAAGPVAVKTPEAGGPSLAITFASREHFTMARFDRHEIVTLAILGGALPGLSWCRGMARRSGPMIGPLLQLALVPASVALDMIFNAPDHEQEDRSRFATTPTS